MNHSMLKLLVVDDDPDVGYFMKHYLSFRKFEVSVAHSAEQALAMLKEHPADIILLDMLMKGATGKSAAKIIKEKYPNTKIIVLTAYPEMAKSIETEVALEGIFTKPMGLEEIYTKLTALSEA